MDSSDIQIFFIENHLFLVYLTLALVIFYFILYKIKNKKTIEEIITKNVQKKKEVDEYIVKSHKEFLLKTRESKIEQEAMVIFMKTSNVYANFKNHRDMILKISKSQYDQDTKMTAIDAIIKGNNLAITNKFIDLDKHKTPDSDFLDIDHIESNEELPSIDMTKIETVKD